jgi:hypothetical protein
VSPTVTPTVCSPGPNEIEPPTPSEVNPGPGGPGGEECEEDFSDCNSFAIFNCRTSGLDVPDGALCVYLPYLSSPLRSSQGTGNRNLQVLKAAIGSAKNVKADGSSTLQKLIESGDFAKQQDIIDAMNHHLEYIVRLESMVQATI